MLKRSKFLVLLVSVVLYCGCLTASRAIKNPARPENTKRPESVAEVKSALGSVTGALAGEEVKDEDLNRLARDLRKDKQAQSAVEAVTNSLSGSRSDLKYCPVDGQRFSSKIQICPIHKVELKTLED